MTSTPCRAARFPGTCGATGGSARWRDRIEEGPHAQTSMDRRRDARRGDARSLRWRGPTAARTWISIEPTICRVRPRTPRGTCPSLVPSSTCCNAGRSTCTSRRNAPRSSRAADPRARRSGRDGLDRSRTGKAFELNASFVVPQLDGESYALRVCNEPCTISGFREPLTGTISIVATAREGELLNQVDLLNRQAWNLRRQVRKAERVSEEPEPSSGRPRWRSRLAIRVRELAAAAAARPTPSGRRPLVSTWVALTLAGGLVALALALVVRRGDARAGGARPDRRHEPHLGHHRAEGSGRVASASDGSTDRVPAGPRPADPGRRHRVGHRMDPVRPRSPRQPRTSRGRARSPGRSSFQRLRPSDLARCPPRVAESAPMFESSFNFGAATRTPRLRRRRMHSAPRRPLRGPAAAGVIRYPCR